MIAGIEMAVFLIWLNQAWIFIKHKHLTLKSDDFFCLRIRKRISPTKKVCILVTAPYIMESYLYQFSPVVQKLLYFGAIGTKLRALCLMFIYLASLSLKLMPELHLLVVFKTNSVSNISTEA